MFNKITKANQNGVNYYNLYIAAISRYNLLLDYFGETEEVLQRLLGDAKRRLVYIFLINDFDALKSHFSTGPNAVYKRDWRKFKFEKSKVIIESTKNKM